MTPELTELPPLDEPKLEPRPLIPLGAVGLMLVEDSPEERAAIKRLLLASELMVVGENKCV